MVLPRISSLTFLCCYFQNTDALSAGSQSFFEMLNKIRECGASRLIIDLSSSAVTMKESEQRAMKEQLNILLAVLFPSEFPRYRAADAIFTNTGLFDLLGHIDGRRRTFTDPLSLAVHSPSTVQKETRSEGKYNHTRQRTFISKIAINSDRLFAEYTKPLKQQYLKGRWYAPEEIIVVVSPTFSPHVSDFILHLTEQHLAKIVGFGVAKGDTTADAASFFTLAPHGIDLSYSSSYLSQQDPNLTLPYGQTLQFPLSHSYTITRNSFPKASFLVNIHPDFVLPLSSFRSVRNYSFDHTNNLSALVKPVFDKHRNWLRKREKCTYTDSEKRVHGIYGHPQTSSGNTLNA